MYDVIRRIVAKERRSKGFISIKWTITSHVQFYRRFKDYMFLDRLIVSYCFVANEHQPNKSA